MNKEKKPVGKTILLISEEGEQRWLNQKTNGSLWGGGAKGSSETEARKRAGKLMRLRLSSNPRMERISVEKLL